jgi:hypothetical protein
MIASNKAETETLPAPIPMVPTSVSSKKCCILRMRTKYLASPIEQLNLHNYIEAKQRDIPDMSLSTFQTEKCKSDRPSIETDLPKSARDLNFREEKYH